MDLILASIDPLDRLGEMLKEQGIEKKYIDNTITQFKKAMKQVMHTNAAA